MSTGIISSVFGFLAIIAVASSSLSPATHAGYAGSSSQEADSSASKDLLQNLNAPLKRVKEANLSFETLFDAYLDMTPSPIEVGEFFNQTTVWAGMSDWSQVSDWAKTNVAMGKAIQDSQGKILLGLPYGAESVPEKFREAGLVAEVGIDVVGESVLEFPYLKAMKTIATWSVAEQYRLCEEGTFTEAFELGIANARVLRQLCDRQMLEEKFEAFHMLGESMSVQRDLMSSYLGKIPAEVFRRFGTKEFPFLKPSDNERLRRLEMPEGDRLVAEAMLVQVFDRDGDPEPEKLAAVFGYMQSADSPLTRFGAGKRWKRLAQVHGSLTATKEKLTDVYDDWWRRWRLKPYDPVQALPTEFSRLNEIRYAAVVESISDMEGLFEARNKLIVEINGTVLAAGLCGYYREHSDSWPRDREMAYVTYIPKRFDFDPYDKGYGRFQYTYLGSRKQAIDTELGRVYATGCILYARGKDKEDNNAGESSLDGSSGDMVVWPALRTLARKDGLID
jgi:hypothetical protein